MSEDLVLYTSPMSRGRTVRWMLEEVGQPYRAEILEGTDMKKPAYLAINPMGKVPALRHGNTVVTEAAAICAYLADAFPGAGLAPPPGNALRGPYYRWLFFASGPIEQATTMKSFGWSEPPERRGMIGCGPIGDVLNAIEGGLKGRDYLVGDGFTAADLYLGAQISWGMMTGSIEKRPVFEAYVGRIRQRPAAIKAAAIDDALLAAKRPA